MFRVACGSIRLANPPDVRGVHIAIAQLGVDRERRFATTRRLLTPKLQEKLDARADALVAQAWRIQEDLPVDQFGETRPFPVCGEVVIGRQKCRGSDHTAIIPAVRRDQTPRLSTDPR